MSDSHSRTIDNLTAEIAKEMQQPEEPQSEKDLAYAERLKTTHDHLSEHPTDEYEPAMKVVRKAHSGKGIGRSKFYALRKEVKAELHHKKKGSVIAGLVTRGRYAGQPLSTKPDAVAKRERYAAAKQAKQDARLQKKAKKLVTKAVNAAPTAHGVVSLSSLQSCDQVEMVLKTLSPTLERLGYVELTWSKEEGFEVTWLPPGPVTKRL